MLCINLIVLPLLFISMVVVAIHNRMRNIPMQYLRHNRNDESSSQETAD